MRSFIDFEEVVHDGLFTMGCSSEQIEVGHDSEESQ